ncbi:MAG: S1C family serine protease [Nitrososphaerales archaeon]
MNNSYKQNPSCLTLIVVILLIGLLSGGFFTYIILAPSISNLQNEVRTLQKQFFDHQPVQDVNVYQNLTSLSELYQRVKDSVVAIRGIVSTFSGYSQIEGSGFVYNYSGQMFVITNFHVVRDVLNITVTFNNGNAYRAIVRGFDAYADLAVLETQNTPQAEFKPLSIVSSSTLRVGDPIIAIGNPFGLTCSMTTGIVSQLGRSIPATGGFRIANVIQISTPINPGNSGGPLLNYAGSVVGITTAIVAGSQGVGFAIPSDTILRVIPWLIETGSYTQHPWIGVSGIDMRYEIAEVMGVNVTYGWLITQVVSGGPAWSAGLRGGTHQVEIAGQVYTVGGDIVIAVNGTRIIDGDNLSSYLEAKTLPGDVIILTVVRNNQFMNITLTLGIRPPPST